MQTCVRSAHNVDLRFRTEGSAALLRKLTIMTGAPDRCPLIAVKLNGAMAAQNPWKTSTHLEFCWVTEHENENKKFNVFETMSLLWCIKPCQTQEHPLALN